MTHRVERVPAQYATWELERWWERQQRHDRWKLVKAIAWGLLIEALVLGTLAYVVLRKVL